MVQYECERCAKKFEHRGDYCRHLDRKTPCNGGENAPTLLELKERLAKLESEIKGEVKKEEKKEESLKHPVSKDEFLEMLSHDNNGVILNEETYQDYNEYLSKCLDIDDARKKYSAGNLAGWRRKAMFEELFEKYHVFDVIGENTKKSVTIKQYREWFVRFLDTLAGDDDEEIPDIPEEIKSVDADGTISKFNTMIIRMENSLYRIGIVGTSARDSLIPLLILRLLQKHIKNNVIDVMNIEEHQYNHYRINEENIKYVLIENYADLDAASASDMLRTMWEHVLSRHPVTCKIFEVGKYIDIRNDIILLSIIKEFIEFDFESCSPDNLSLAYQHFIHRQFKGESGSRMGQHFTPDRLINMMVNEYKDNIPREGNYIDPFMGTAGFVMGVYNATKSERSDDKPSDYLHGTEIDPNVFKYAFTNLLVQTGDICTNIKNISAFGNHKEKYSAIFTNPPFGSTILKEEKNSTLSYNFANVLNRNLVCLQYCMHLLAPGGICSMVWVNGAECFGSSKSAIQVRKKLFTKFQFLGAILVPGQKKVFEHAGIKPIILTFRKPLPGEEVIPILKISECGETCESVKFIVEIDADKLKEKDYAISVDEYKEREEMQASDEFEIKTLGEVCEIKNGKFQSNDMSGKGDVPFYTCSAKNPSGKHDQFSFDYEEYLLLITAGGSENNKYGDNVGLGKVLLVKGKTACRSGVWCLLPKNKNLLVEYLYYYLFVNKKYVADLAIFTTNLGTIKRDSLSKLQIPVPSIKKQQEIIDIAKKLEKQVNNYQNVIEGLSWEIEAIKRFKPFVKREYEIKTLGEVCKFGRGQQKTKKELKGDKYLVVGGGEKTMGRIDEFNTEPNTVLLSRMGSAGFISMYDEKVFATESIIKIFPNEKFLDNNYVYYLTKHGINKQIKSIAYGSAQPGINVTNLSKLQIPVPPMEEQLEIIEKYKNMEKEIESKFETKKQLESMKEEVLNIMKKQFS